MRNRKEAIVAGGGMLGLALLVVAAPGRTDPAPSAAEPCCAIASVDAAKLTVTVKTNDGKHTFAMKLANAASARGIRQGTPVSFSNEELTLWAGTRAVKLVSITYVPVASQSGAVASAATSPGKWIRRAPQGGKCPSTKTVTTSTGSVDCVLTHDRTAEGKGCEYYCV